MGVPGLVAAIPPERGGGGCSWVETSQTGPRSSFLLPGLVTGVAGGGCGGSACCWVLREQAPLVGVFCLVSGGGRRGGVVVSVAVGVWSSYRSLSSGGGVWWRWWGALAVGCL